MSRLALPYRNTVPYELADRYDAMFDIYAGSVEWDGRWRTVFVSAAEGGPLVGMGLMEGYHLAIDVIDGGRVEIRPLRE